jgi:hypothetical protein
MFRMRSILPIGVMILCAALAGCGGTGQFGGQTQNNGNSSVVIAMTDFPPSTVSVLSAEVTLTGVTLTGTTPATEKVSIFSGSTTVELTRLQTDIGYIATAMNIPAGNYSSVTLTFANPLLTIENDTASAIGSCTVGSICTLTPVSSNLSTTVPLTSFQIASSSVTGLLIDVNLDNLLNATLGADFSAATVTSFTPAGTAAPPVGAEDVVGHVASVNASNNTFTLSNAAGSFTLKVDGTSTFFQFPNSACSNPGFACLKTNQILSVDIGIQADGSILARNILFEDADSSDIEVEGEITSTNVASQQFSLVVHTISGSGTGLTIGEPATVQYSVAPQTPFDVDFLHVDSVQESTTSFSAFHTGPADLVAGQEVSLRRNSSSTNSTIVADRVRLRSSRVTATVQSEASSIITIGQNSSLPSLFSGHGGVTQILAQTSVTPPTTYYEIGGTINSSTNLTNDPVSVRGPLFNTGGTSRTLLATRVVLK